MADPQDTSLPEMDHLPLNSKTVLERRELLQRW